MALPPDTDPQETREWLDALDSVFDSEGVERAHYLVGRLIRRARRKGAYLPYSANTAYVNTIPEAHERRSPGDHAIEHRIRSIIRWNAMAMVVQANRVDPSLGGHISSFASAADNSTVKLFSVATDSANNLTAPTDRATRSDGKLEPRANVRVKINSR